jgi:primase-polymerase (primpol)-like protein
MMDMTPGGSDDLARLAAEAAAAADAAHALSLIRRPPISLPAALAPMLKRRQWVCWMRWAGQKLPLSTISKRAASSEAPAGWTDFEAAHKWYRNGSEPAGIGFYFTDHPDDQLCCVDFDGKAWDAISPENRAKASACFEACDTYAELSPGGQGAHCYGFISPSLKFELAGFSSYFGCVDLIPMSGYATVTGKALRGDMPIKNIDKFVRMLLLHGKPSHGRCPTHRFTPQQDARTASELIVKLRSGRAAARFSFLIEAPWQTILAEFSGDHSSADAALAGHICNATRDPARALEIFRQSTLYRGLDLARTGKTKRKSTQRYEDDYLIRLTFGGIWTKKERTQDALDRIDVSAVIPPGSNRS